MQDSFKEEDPISSFPNVNSFGESATESNSTNFETNSRKIDSTDNSTYVNQNKGSYSIPSENNSSNGYLKDTLGKNVEEYRDFDKKQNSTRRQYNPILNLNGGKSSKAINSKTRKRIVDPAISYIKSLIKIYPKTEKLEYDANVVCNGKQFPQYNYVYGEINYDGIEKLYKVLMSMFFDDYVFIDLGSGNGRVPLYLASKQQIVRSFGVELVKERYDFSLTLLNKLKKRTFQQFIQKIHLYNEDMFNIDISKMVSIRNEPTLKSIVWMSNLCFKEEHTRDILEKLSKEVEEGSLVCFSKIFEDIITKPLINAKTIQHNTRIKNTNFLFVRTINIGMSWNTEHLIHIFIKSIEDFEDDDEDDENDDTEDGLEYEDESD
jgi:hypothetical protein